MSIDLEHETLITFAQLASRLPPRRGGRPVHVSTVHRWRQPGIRGVRLEAVRIGGGWVTTSEAFARFCNDLTVGEDDSSTRLIGKPTDDARRAAAELPRAGW